MHVVEAPRPRFEECVVRRQSASIREEGLEPEVIGVSRSILEALLTDGRGLAADHAFYETGTWGLDDVHRQRYGL